MAERITDRDPGDEREERTDAYERDVKALAARLRPVPERSTLIEAALAREESRLRAEADDYLRRAFTAKERDQLCSEADALEHFRRNVLPGIRENCDADHPPDPGPRRRSPPRESEREADLMSCIGCGQDFDPGDEVQSIYHESACVEVNNLYPDIAATIAARLRPVPERSPEVGEREADPKLDALEAEIDALCDGLAGWTITHPHFPAAKAMNTLADALAAIQWLRAAALRRPHGGGDDGR